MQVGFFCASYSPMASINSHRGLLYLLARLPRRDGALGLQQARCVITTEWITPRLPQLQALSHAPHQVSHPVKADRDPISGQDLHHSLATGAGIQAAGARDSP
jgi:hypothetical protein